VVIVDTGVDNSDISSSFSVSAVAACFTISVGDLGVNPVNSPRQCLRRVASTTATGRTAIVTGVMMYRLHRPVTLNVPYITSPGKGGTCLTGEPASDGLPDRPEVENTPYRCGARPGAAYRRR
jgi:hypothetical protein